MLKQVSVLIPIEFSLVFLDKYSEKDLHLLQGNLTVVRFGESVLFRDRFIKNTRISRHINRFKQGKGGGGRLGIK